jgi:hypothetical protein
VRGRASFALATFMGAFLLFQVQPLLGKYILPWFGGGPGVWTACLMFFQVMLLAGYVYAHFLSRLATPRAQAVAHVLLIGGAIASLPITPGADWKPTSPENPVWRILWLLTVSVGLPYFALSATGPLMQAWFSHVNPMASPYRLYALSNAGSLLALLSYPPIFEQFFSRATQGSLWGWTLGAFGLCTAACARHLLRSPADGRLSSPAAEIPQDHPAPGAGIRFLWLALPACASVLLLAVTNTICQDVAAMPFLWVLPLTLYLASFVLCFEGPRWYSRRAYTCALVLAAALLCFALATGHRGSLVAQVTVYLTALFVCCMVCHGELYRLRPPPRWLTSFYLQIATGGAAGGVFVALVAPLLFTSYAELHWGLWLLSGLLVLIHVQARSSLALGARRIPGWPLAAAGAAALGLALVVVSQQRSSGSIHEVRNFYGALRVTERVVPEELMVVRELYHGSTLHGVQMLPPHDSLRPVGYYEKGSGAELAFSRFPRRGQRRIGVVGLGTGALSVYGNPTDVVRFYEINPEIKHVAQTMFTFLAGSKASVEIVLGDGRIVLESEPPREFDLLVLDAFSSDAIPVHLLTREAFALYLRHLRPDGALLFNVTNRHLDLRPVVEAATAEFQLEALALGAITPAGAWAPSELVWMLASRNTELMRDPLIRSAARDRRSTGRRVLWTDEQSGLLQVMRRRLL